MALLLIKRVLQNVKFCEYSPSIVSLACLFASTAFIKHSKSFRCDETSKFSKLTRKIMVEILEEELEEQ
jgi:hypothetical protein